MKRFNFFVSFSRQTLTNQNYSRQFHTKGIRSKYRIGPHNIDIISVLVGCLLGDGHAYKSETGGTRFRFKQSIRHKDYLFFLYEFLSHKGYSSNNGPKQYQMTLVNANGTKNSYYGYEFNTFTFNSLDWLYDLFYVNKIKRITPELAHYITPMALAFLIMDDGCWVATSKSIRIATNCFTGEEVDLLRNILESKFGIQTTKQLLSKKQGNSPKDKYSIYVKVVYFTKLKELVVPYFCPSMKYKLGL